MFDGYIYIDLVMWSFPSDSPSSVNGFDRLHRQRRCNQVISVVPTPAHRQQPLNLPNHKHQAALWGGVRGTHRGVSE